MPVFGKGWSSNSIEVVMISRLETRTGEKGIVYGNIDSEISNPKKKLNFRKLYEFL